MSLAPLEQGIPKEKRGIPGRVFVLCFVPILILLSGITFGIGYRFQVIMNRLEQVRSLWPNASVELKERYDRLSVALAEANASPEKVSQMANLRLSFDQASQFDSQSVAAFSIERAIPMLIDSKNWKVEDFRLPALQKLLESDRERASVQNDSLGWLTVRSLRLKLPPIFDPTSPSNSN